MENTEDYQAILCLLPENYEIEKDALIQLWMAGEYIKDELQGEEAFRAIFDNGCLLRSATSSMNGGYMYRVNIKKIYQLTVGRKQIGNLYLKWDNEYQKNSRPVESFQHVSLMCDVHIDENFWRTLQRFDNLRTLLFLGNHGRRVQQHVLDQLFLRLANLQALDLSKTQIEELPISIGRMIHLRYLNLSWTRIDWLPDTLCYLGELQTLKLRGCSNLHELPEQLEKLTTIRHLDFDVLRQLKTMPKGMGALVNLRTLSAFLVGAEDGCKIQELEGLNKLAGSFCIAKLENVEDKDVAKKASLDKKKSLKKLELRWTESEISGEHHNSYAILECLKPSASLEELRILCYEGWTFPFWVSNPEFNTLTHVTFYKCENVSELPPIELLPSLKHLRLIKMNNIEKIDRQGTAIAFPKLEKLEIDEMEILKAWQWEKRNTGDFEVLAQLTIIDCPELHEFDVVPHLSSLKLLEIEECPKILESLNKIAFPISLQVTVDDCPFIQKEDNKGKGVISFEEGDQNQYKADEERDVRYDDDHATRTRLITSLNEYQGNNVGAFENEGTTAMYYIKMGASLKSEKFTVLLELTGIEGNESDERPGLDVVIVLDVSGSMRGKNLEHMKTASKFLVKKLSPIDRLSIVKFSSQAERLCPLTFMSEDAQSNIEGVIHGLIAHGGTNMTAGLEVAVKVLNDRRFKEGRAVAIMFLSDGDPSKNLDGSHVAFGDIPVHTFGLGHDYHPKVLTSIAARSNGGTFNASDVDNPGTSNLSVAFAQCLGGLLSVVVKDLTMIITEKDSTIEKVSVGIYPQTRDDPRGTVVIRFGNLYCRETRNILVDLVLDEVNKPKGSEILEFTYFYKRVVVGEVEYDAPPMTISVTRTTTPSAQEIPKVLKEMARQGTAEKMKDARILADDRCFDDAKAKLDEAKTNLELNDQLDQADPLIMGLLAEVKQFKNLMETPETYDKLGRAFAFASELSHALQRASARGDVSELRLFTTKAMNQAVDQATKYEKNPDDCIVPTAVDDLKERIVEQKVEEEKEEEEEKKKNPYAPIIEALSTHLDDVIKSLSAIKELLNKTI